MRGYWAIGLMTGTALDGFVDAALVRTDGENILELGPFELFPYSASDRDVLASAVAKALKWQFKGPEPEVFSDATNVITKLYAGAIDALIKKSGIPREKIDFIGGHGLTVLHHPPFAGHSGNTLQLLDGQMLADLVGIKTIYDFRSNDISCGGQGAPLAPIYHAALLRFTKLSPPAAILNLGGVANITYWAGENNIAAFDCGPANGPINELVEAKNAGTFDRDGELASKGTPDFERLRKLLANPWFDEKYPKSLDRYDFSAKLVDGLSLQDGCATLSALVGMAINKGLELFDTRPSILVVAGGGRKNPQLMRDIEKYAKVRLINSDEIGLRGDAVEAECFAYLAVRSALGLPISFPSTTGVNTPVIGGRLAIPEKKTI